MSGLMPRTASYPRPIRSRVPARKLSIMMSASRARASTMSTASGAFRFRLRLRLLRLKERNWVLSPCQKGVQERVSSPRSGSSILMTSAPMSPSIMVQKGPARVRVRSTTLIFCRAAVIVCCPSGAIGYVQAACFTPHYSEKAGAILCQRRGAAGKGWHHLLCKQAQRAQCLLVWEGAPGERADHVVAAAYLQQLCHLLTHARWRAEEDSLVLGGRLPGEDAIGRVVVMSVPQLGDRAVPVPVSSTCGCQGLGIGVGDEHLADDAHLGHGHVAIQPVRCLAMRLPGLPVDIHQLAYPRRRAEADEMIAVS